MCAHAVARVVMIFFFFSSRRRHTRFDCDWSSDVCSSDLGHLTHGAAVNFSGSLFRAVSYGVREETGRIDYDEVRAIARRERPRLLIGGGSADPPLLDFPGLHRNAAPGAAALLLGMGARRRARLAAG